MICEFIMKGSYLGEKKRVIDDPELVESGFRVLISPVHIILGPVCILCGLVSIYINKGDDLSYLS
ncbi:hypothetical protein Hanom_Chr16g01503871 [Helianthus anomalus]